MHQKAAGSILGQGTYSGCGFDPQLGHVQEAAINFFCCSPPLSVSLSQSLPPSLSLSL